VWHARCYRIEPKDPFPRGLRPAIEEDLGDGAAEEASGWDYTQSEQEEVDGEYVTARPGDHLMSIFQCEKCHFRNINQRDPETGRATDDWALTCIRRANLDSFWSSRPSTVESNLRESAVMARCTAVLGFREPFRDFPRGPFPLRDTQGMMLAAVTLQRSFDKGVNSRTIQWDTCRKLRSFCSNYIHTTPEGTGLATLTDGSSSTHFTSSPTNTVWFRKFMGGFHNRLGDVIIQDQAISIDELLALQAILEDAWATAKAEGNRELCYEIAVLAVSTTSGFASGLRGEELAHIRLDATRANSQRGLVHPRKPHCALSLLGRFKGVIGRRKHQIPLVPTTASGIEVKVWLFRLLALYDEAGIVGGPLLRPALTGRNSARIKDLDVLLHKYLVLVQQAHPELIASRVDVGRAYSLRRSLPMRVYGAS
jgi:hypothetical protein